MCKYAKLMDKDANVDIQIAKDVPLIMKYKLCHDDCENDDSENSDKIDSVMMLCLAPKVCDEDFEEIDETGGSDDSLVDSVITTVVKSVVVKKDEDIDMDISKIKQQSITSFMTNLRKARDNTLFNYKRTLRHDMYSRYCGAVDNRQPIILTMKQEQEYKKNNPEAYNSGEITLLEWGSSVNNKNYNFFFIIKFSYNIVHN